MDAPEEPQRRLPAGLVIADDLGHHGVVREGA
jgi:hypothetical protein